MARLEKDDWVRLPRVTAYCSASSYKVDDLMRFLKGRAKTKSAAPKVLDECLYSPYRYKQEGSGRRRSRGADQQGEQEAREAVSEVRSEPVRRFSDSAIEVKENAERRRDAVLTIMTSNLCGDRGVRCYTFKLRGSLVSSGPTGSPACSLARSHIHRPSGKTS